MTCLMKRRQIHILSSISELSVADDMLNVMEALSDGNQFFFSRQELVSEFMWHGPRREVCLVVVVVVVWTLANTGRTSVPLCTHPISSHLFLSPTT